MGVDFGKKRIGIAFADSETKIPTAAKPVQPSGTLARDAVSLVELARREEATQIVLGAPVYEADSRMANVCARLANEMIALGMETVIVDEAFSSVLADQNLRMENLTAAARKKLVDGEAACVILSRYFAGCE